MEPDPTARPYRNGVITSRVITARRIYLRLSERPGSSFTDNTRLVIMGNANNKEENAGWWNRRGLNSQKMLGGNINYDDGKKLKIDGSIRWNHRDGDNQNENSS